MRNYGLCFEQPDPNAHVFGGVNDFPVINESGQWDNWLPVSELQKKSGVETNACASFGTLSALEILIKFKYSQERNYSDRWLAWNSGTNPARGNDPHRVSETLRKAGVPYEVDWSFEDVKDTADFYKNPPPKLFEKAREFITTFEYQHQYADVKDIKDALKRSPLGASVTAWKKKGDVYTASKTSRNNHWVVLYGFDDVKGCWKVWDSYDNTKKLYTYDSPIEVVKVYHIDVKTEHKQSFIIKLMELVIEKLKQLTMTPPTKSQLLLQAVHASLGKDASPKDLVHDSFGCAETASNIIQQVDKTFPIVTGTWSIWDVLRPRCIEVDVPQAGDIILSVTGQGNGKVSNGHIAFFLNDTDIASNDSKTGLFLQNYTLASWREYYGNKGGYPIYIYRLI